MPGVIECAECGHDIIGVHSARGCQFNASDPENVCSCAVGWTQVQKRALVREQGYDYRT